MTARDRLIVALDVPRVEDARALVKRIGDAASFYKIGLELLYAGGADLARELIAAGSKVFLDAKLLDIPNTVERATANIAKLGASFLTIHGIDRKTLDAALKGRGSSDLKLLAVTVLTSLGRADLAEQGIDQEPAALVQHRARLAQKAGFDGIVCSAQEAAAIRTLVGPDMLIVTPGIRPAGAETGDQARVMTPARAIAAGADYIVVGRPVSQAKDPRAAAAAIVQEIETAS
jgi:orotidine-5'-phosphate decarboxylase